ncbi:MAG: 50S ribosomal protein L10 [Pseudomonadota bacterium]
MTREAKKQEVASLNERFEDSEIVLLTHNKGLDAQSVTDLRLKMREGDVQFKVVKNTLAKIAVKGTRYEQIADMFAGPVGMATSKDPVSAAKAANDFAKKNDNFVILGGAYGDMILDEAGVKQLASMPSLEELRATIAACIMSPARNIAGAINAPGGKIAGAVKAVAEKAE